MKKIQSLGLSLILMGLCSSPLMAAKNKPEAISFEEAKVISEMVEKEGKKPKKVFFLEVDGEKIPFRNGKLAKKLVGKNVKFSGKALKAGEKWQMITTVAELKEIK